MKIRFLILLLLLLSLESYGQVGGETVYNFLNISTTARQTALGGKVLTLIDDVNQPIWNPSVINPDLDKKLSVNYSSYLAGVNIGSISYSKLINRRFGNIHGSIKYLNYGSIIRADENGVESGTFNASDIAISIGYARNLPWTNFYIGSNVKIIHSSIANFSSTGIAIDLALLYNNPYKDFVLTLVARNIGTQLSSFNEDREQLPFELAIGGSYKLEHVPLKWYFTMDNLQQWNVAVANPSNKTTDLEGNITKENIGFLDNMFRHFVVGAELFPERSINLRVGYNFRRASELKLQNVRTFGGISFGFGVKINKIKINYAYSKVHTASNISTFSLQIDLNK